MDRLMMQMNDIESRLMNCSKEESELAALIYNEVKFKTVADANSFITELRRIMSIMHLQIKQSEQEKNMMKEQINVLEDCKVKLLIYINFELGWFDRVAWELAVDVQILPVYIFEIHQGPRSFQRLFRDTVIPREQ